MLSPYALSLAIFLGLCWTALSQEGQHGKGHEKWHGEFYSKLMRPDTDKKNDSCCNLRDCYPTASRASPFGYYEVMIHQGKDSQGNPLIRWVLVPQKKIVPVTAPDLGAHVCHQKIDPRYPDNVNLYCVVLPPEV